MLDWGGTPGLSVMAGLDFRVADVDGVCEAARARGYDISGNEFLLGGVTFRLVE